MRTITILAVLLTASSLFAEVIAPNNLKKLDYRTSWIGNSYGGLNPDTGEGQWVQQDIAAMCVTPDGTVYTNVPWEEGGGNCMMYKDGQMLGAAYHTHGWGFNGGKAVAVNDKYVFIALIGNNEGGGLNDPDTWAPKGFDWYGISRRLRSDFTQGAPFEHGKGGKGDTLPKSFLVINAVPTGGGIDGPAAITGLWADNERLYVANPHENRIEIYDAETMKKLTEWKLPDGYKGKMRSIAMNPDGNLWVLVQRPVESLLGERFLVFDKEGKLHARSNKHQIQFSGNVQYCPIEIPEGWEPIYEQLDPTAFCFDNQGRLLVADGKRHIITVFDKNGKNYELTKTWETHIGRIPKVYWRDVNYDDLIFRNITAIGCDAQGNVYVASDWATNGGGVILESYAPTTEPVGTYPPNEFFNTLFQSHWKLNWRLFGLCFIDCTTLDPDDETIVYTKEERYKIDWSKEPGKEWSLLGHTAFRFKGNSEGFNEYANSDPRVRIGDSAPVWVRNLDGKKFLFVSDMNSARLQVYALDFSDKDNPVRAAVLFSPMHYKNRDGSEPKDWMPGQPQIGEWIWTNGQPHAMYIYMDDWRQEFSSHTFYDDDDIEKLMFQPEVHGIEGWWVDTKGDVWQTTHDKGLRRFRYQGLKDISDYEWKGSNPVWNFDNLDTFPHPAEFKQVKRIRYYPETDTLYLGGCAVVDGKEHKNQHWKPMGAVICRYDNFLKGNNPGKTEGKLKWQTVLPYVVGSSGHESCEPMGFDVAGEYIFVPYTGASKESGFKTGHVEVIRSDNASPVGWMEPDPKTVGEVGLQDIRECLSAHQLKSGEYV
ncbi:MAG: hypothetical protein LBI05_05395, partial [Planctomycetaceae bacterium]|nr:hypothetical protein [Planctomycetaceae bacterium]